MSHPDLYRCPECHAIVDRVEGEVPEYHPVDGRLCFFGKPEPEWAKRVVEVIENVNEGPVGFRLAPKMVPK